MMTENESDAETTDFYHHTLTLSAEKIPCSRGRAVPSCVTMMENGRGVKQKEKKKPSCDACPKYLFSSK